MAGATVRANFVGEPTSGERRERVPDILTGPDGRFEFRALEPGRYDVEATRAGYSAAAHGRTRRDGESELIRVADGQRMTGVVLTLLRLGAINEWFNPSILERLAQSARSLTLRDLEIKKLI